MKPSTTRKSGDGRADASRPLILTMCRGLPASGKSTWAAGQVLAAQPGTVVRLNRDSLREMLHAGRWTKGRTERQTIAALDALIDLYLGMGVDVIVDDTNLSGHHETRLREIAARHGAAFFIEDFTHVDVETCIARDLDRSHSVGERVIREMFRRYLWQPPAPPDAPDGAPAVVLVDVDGTIALLNGRSPYAWDRVGEDLPNAPVVELVRSLASTGLGVVYLSGRDGVCRDATEAWIVEHVGVPGALHMRAPGDNRMDAVVKRELFDAHIAGRFRVVAVLDDRKQVVDMWRNELGLACLQVAPGDF